MGDKSPQPKAVGAVVLGVAPRYRIAPVYLTLLVTKLHLPHVIEARLYMQSAL